VKPLEHTIVVLHSKIRAEKSKNNTTLLLDFVQNTQKYDKSMKKADFSKNSF